MKTIAVGEFKAKCLKILDNVGQYKESLVITKRGKPIAQVIPITRALKSDREKLLGAIVHEDDIISPLNEPWGGGGL